MDDKTEALRAALRAAYKRLMDDAEARDYDPPVPEELVIQIEDALAS